MVQLKWQCNMARKGRANFIVEKVENVWKVKPRKYKSNAILETIHPDDLTGMVTELNELWTII